MDAPLTPATLRRAVDRLAGRDPDLALIAARLGPPPLWSRAPGFPTLVHIILEQQVSLASARAAFGRLRRAVGRLTPRAFLALDDASLRAIGFSRQKASYCRALARAVDNRSLRLAALAHLDDATARGELTRQTGIGPWTADIYLLMALGRPDVWPPGDLALAKAMRAVKRLEEVPGRRQMERLAEPWRPWRAVAARMLWSEYLSW